MRARLIAAALAAAGCVQSNDPAEGGFYSGVAGLAGGGYKARIAEREAAVAAAQSRQTALAAELAGLEREHRTLQARLGAQRSALRSAGVAIPPATELRLDAALAGPAETDPAARAAALERAIGDARQLSEQLAALSG
jgi:hypothetical protein